MGAPLPLKRSCVIHTVIQRIGNFQIVIYTCSCLLEFIHTRFENPSKRYEGSQHEHFHFSVMYRNTLQWLFFLSLKLNTQSIEAALLEHGVEWCTGMITRMMYKIYSEEITLETFSCKKASQSFGLRNRNTVLLWHSNVPAHVVTYKPSS